MRSLNGEWAQRCAIALGLLLFVLVRVVEGWPELTLPSILASLESTTTLWGIAFAIFVAEAWKWKIWRHWLVTIEDLSGCWTGTLRARQKDGTFKPIAVVVEIRQALLHADVTVWTVKTKSISYVAETYCDSDNGEQRIAYCYRAAADIEYRDGNERHEGAASLTATGAGERLRGEYWTDRRTVGKMDLARRSTGACPDPQGLARELTSKAAAGPEQGQPDESA